MVNVIVVTIAWLRRESALPESQASRLHRLLVKYYARLTILSLKPPTI